MRFQIPPPEIPADDPFAGDVLGRKNAAMSITELLQRAQEPLVVSINAPWGQGKTTFLHMLEAHLLQQGIVSLYLNAWENDFSKDAFITLLGDLENAIEDLKQTHRLASDITARLSAITKSASGVVMATLPTAVRLLTSGMVNVESLDRPLSKLAGDITEETIVKHHQARKSVEAFRKELSGLAGAITKAEDSGPTNQLVIFVDELDRCRPDYAVDYLESIKHFFSVPGVIFVLALDREQIGHSVRTLYGTDMDVDGYIRRFIDIEFNLPEPTYESFAHLLFKKFGFEEYFAARGDRDRSLLVTLIVELAALTRLSLRDMEKMCAALSLVFATTPANYKLFPPLLAVLLVLKIKNPKLYCDYVSGKTDEHKVMQFLKGVVDSDEPAEFQYEVLVDAFLLAAPRGTRRDEAISTHHFLMENEPVSTESSSYKKVAEMLEYLESSEFRDVYGCLDYLAEKIDLVSQGPCQKIINE